MDGLCAWKLLGDGRFVFRIMAPAIIGQQSHFMMLCEVPEDIEGTNLASGIDGQQLSSFYPKYFHTPVRLPADPFVRCACRGPVGFLKVDQVHHKMAGTDVRIQSLAVNGAGTDYHNFRELENVLEIRAKK